ncbi:MAG: molybdopterin-dependent oxidoreductase, partial [Flavobacteriaceae bacterium]|nr:molybdopterin-dependent oxidoreductase [Flavobacteriaceae bacterium]
MRSDKISELYFSDVNQPVAYDRREFLKKLGGGIIVVFFLGKLSLLNGHAQNATDEDLNFNAYLRVKEDGTVNCYTGKIEMGQGVITSLAQVLAEELEVSIGSVNMIMGDTDLCPYDAGTWGSLTTRFADPVLRAAAAEAREILIGLASKELGVNTDLLEVSDGNVYLKEDRSKSVTYAALTKGKKIVQSLELKPKLKTSKDFKIIGKPIISQDAVAKVTGKAQYAGDIKLPGMVYAKVVRPAVFGSKKVKVDASGLSAFDGVQLIEADDLVAVIHADPEVANKAAKKVKVTWDAPEAMANNETIFQYLEAQIKDSKTFEEAGSLASGKDIS